MKEFNPNYLDFEQPLLEIEGKIKQIKNYYNARHRFKNCSREKNKKN